MLGEEFQSCLAYFLEYLGIKGAYLLVELAVQEGYTVLKLVLYLLYGADEKVFDDRGGVLTKLRTQGGHTGEKILLEYLYLIALGVVLLLGLGFL